MRGPNDIRPTELHLWLSKGGLGDTVARLPAIRFILDNYRHVTRVRVFLQDYAVELATHLLNDGRVEVYGYAQARELLEKYPNTPAMMTDAEHHTTLRTHLTDHAFHTLADEIPGEWDKNYLQIRADEIDVSEFHLREPYIVITTGFTAPVREMLPAYVNELASWHNMLGKNVVFLGKKQSEFWKGEQPPTEANFRDEIDFSTGLDLRDGTTLLQAAKIMGEAEAVVGLDNGLLHLAATTEVPIVAGYTTVRPKDRLPYRMGQLGWNVKTVTLTKEELGCTFCQSQKNFVYNSDFRRCPYGDYKCVEMLTPDRYKEALMEVLFA
jgi:ADP-heptose:LPS heptosyltransferase